MFTCPDCGMDFMDEPDFMDHIKNYDHALNIDTDKCRKYNDIVMLPGTSIVKLSYKIRKFCILSTNKLEINIALCHITIHNINFRTWSL